MEGQRLKKLRSAKAAPSIPISRAHLPPIITSPPLSSPRRHATDAPQVPVHPLPRLKSNPRAQAEPSRPLPAAVEDDLARLSQSCLTPRPPPTTHRCPRPSPMLSSSVARPGGPHPPPSPGAPPAPADPLSSDNHTPLVSNPSSLHLQSPSLSC
jgi:hypothetical protein